MFNCITWPWIYIYICNQYLSLLKFVSLTPSVVGVLKYNLMWSSLSVTLQWTIVFVLKYNLMWSNLSVTLQWTIVFVLKYNLMWSSLSVTLQWTIVFPQVFKFSVDFHHFFWFSSQIKLTVMIYCMTELLLKAMSIMHNFSPI
jgi:hypothetical protein